MAGLAPNSPACWDTCQSFKLPIGLYRDLAVGVAEGGAETWCDRELYCLKASVGAPPDILGPLGQKLGAARRWTRISLSPGRMSPLSTLLRANMQKLRRVAH
ncbi:4-alpha-glucanotransferase [Salmonella enterica subsp. enterica]|uniref:4-alpha-glucanotransferase n=1 Tax=Salmonella enterica I TaxID=59201 RepID=A0A3S4HZ51_SALET|nr:4-alpha-glucanotransferase [Salmonella enterica subsp. enterica]